MSALFLIAAGPGQALGALVETGRIVELFVERDTTPSLVGALFLGRVIRVLPALPGAFIELGLDRPAFLQGGAGLVEGASLLVQVVRDAFEDKAAEVTASPSFQGRYAVWTPSRAGLAVSNKLPPAERARLSALAAPLVAPGEGVVLRTHAQGASREDLAADLERLRRDAAALAEAMTTLRAPARLDPPSGLLERLVAAAVQTRTISRILVDGRAAYAALRQAQARGRAVPAETIVDLDPTPGFLDRHGIDAAFAEALGTIVPLDEGARMTVETGLACTLVDVDLAGAGGGRSPAREAIRRVNLAAAAELARQMRLRNLGGAIIADFVSMHAREDRQAVEAALVAATGTDPTPVQVHGFTRLGHLEVTRRRGRAPLADTLLVPGGAPRPKSAETVALEALARAASGQFRPGRLDLRIGGEAAALLAGPLAAARVEAERACGRPIRVVAEADRAPESFDLVEI